MDVFHWHITDSHSFPLLVPSELDLAAKGSYGPDMLYTPDDVNKIVQFGLDHGVRIIPEMTHPVSKTHTGSWAEAYPDIVTCANMFWWPAGSMWEDRLASEPGTGHLNPLNPKTYQVLERVINDVATLFPEPFYHAGADEIIPGCWKADPAIQSFLSNGGTLSQLLEIFVNSTFPYIVSLNRTVVYWEDVILDGNIKVPTTALPPEHTILQTWNNGPENTKKIVSSGYRVIVSSLNFYYLDSGHSDFLGNDSHKEEANLVLGGEVALWSEQADPTVLDARIWPRTSAMAETLWSGNWDETGKKRYAEAIDRLNEWRYRMVRRCIGAKPIQPLWCIRNPGMCNTIHPFA
ncbi:beta-hexosaminidase 2 [Quercus suber]|uniref:beta-N-acetylhexosaminidase n=1 Tax=Quercus suber TaxID=58331 RepID=A0AAW0LJF6_QUESU